MSCDLDFKVEAVAGVRLEFDGEMLVVDLSPFFDSCDDVVFATVFNDVESARCDREKLLFVLAVVDDKVVNVDEDDGGRRFDRKFPEDEVASGFCDFASRKSGGR